MEIIFKKRPDGNNFKKKTRPDGNNFKKKTRWK